MNTLRIFNMHCFLGLTLFCVLSSNSFAKIEVLDRVAIIVGEGVILESQINNTVATFKNRLQQQGVQMPSDEFILEQVHERLIVDELQLQAGRRAGIRVSDAELNQTIAEIASQNNFTIEEFIDDLDLKGESYPEFREQIRKELIIQRVQRGKVGGQILITDQELEAFLETDEAKSELLPEVLVKQILVKSEDQIMSLKDKILEGENFSELASSFSVASNAANGGSLGWRKQNDLPEVFFEALNKKSKGFIAGPIKTGAGYHLLELTDKRGPLVLYEDQWKVRHILMSPTKLRDALFTQQELEEVRRRFINGEEFSLLAKEFSEDPGSANKGGDLGWLSLGVTAKKFEEVFLNTPKGSISEVFESEFGFHFLEVIDKRNYDRTYDLIEDRAYSALFSRKYDDVLENTLRTMRAEAFVEFKELN